MERLGQQSSTPVPAETLRAPSLWIFLPMVAGFGLGGGTGVEVESALAAVGAMVCFVAASRDWVLSWGALLAGSVLLGVSLRASIEPPDAVGEWADLPVREAELVVRWERVVSGPSDFGDGIRYRGTGVVVEAPPEVVEVVGLRVWGSGFASGGDWVPRPGDLLRVNGLLEAVPDGEQGFAAYLRESGIWFRFSRCRVAEGPLEIKLLARLIDRAGGELHRILTLGAPEDYVPASLYASVMLGWKHLIEPEVRDRFRITGTIHVMAVSGLHIGMVILVVFRLARLARVGPRGSLLISLGVSFLHVVVTGSPPSAVRAFVMAVVLSLGPLLGRRYDPASAIAAAAVMVAVLFPRQIGSIGFQLSYFVVAAIVLYAMPLAQWIEIRVQRKPLEPYPMDPAPRRRRWILEKFRRTVAALAILFIVGGAAFLVSVPLTVDDFGTLPWTALLINPVIVPLASLVLLHGVLSIGFGLLGIEAVSAFLNHGAWACLEAMDAVVGLAAGTGWNASGVGFAFPGEGQLLSLAVLGILLALPPVVDGRVRWTAAVAPLCVLGILQLVRFPG